MRLRRLLRAGSGRFDVLYGFDEQLLAACVLGAKGAVGTSYNFAAPLYKRLLAAVAANDLTTARTEQFRGVELIGLLVKYGFLGAAKELMRLRGVDLGGVRLPNTPLTAEQAAGFRRELSTLGFTIG